jgi:hypothetical protein
MSRVPLVVPFWVLGSLSVAIFVMPESRTPLLVAIGAILIAWGLWLRHLLRRHDRGHNTN